MRSALRTEGRWLSPDPLGGGIRNPQSLNRYAYVGNNPTTLIDPLGLGPCPLVDTTDTCGGGNGGGNDFGGYTVDGFSVSNDLGQAALAGGFGCIGSCGTSVTGSNGLAYQIVQTAGPTVYVGPNGEELSDASVTELGLSPIGSAGAVGIGNPFVPSPGGSASGGSAGGTRACTAKILGAVNSTFGTNFTSASSSFFNPPLGSPGAALNLVISATNLPAAQFNAIQLGRYPINWFSYLIGYGSTLHVAGPGALDPNARFSTSNIGGATSITFTAHLDSAYAYNPVGLVLHSVIDVLGVHRNPCP